MDLARSDAVEAELNRLIEKRSSREADPAARRDHPPRPRERGVRPRSLTSNTVASPWRSAVPVTASGVSGPPCSATLRHASLGRGAER